MEILLSRVSLQPWGPAAAVALGLTLALLLQHLLGWAPCPLCIVQRLTAMGLLVSLVWFARSAPATGSRRAALWAAFAMATVGVSASVSHLWILFGPADSSCGPGVARFVGHLVDAVPYSEWLLEGGGACEDTRYQLFGVPLPAWSALLHLVGFGWAFRLRKIDVRRLA